MVLGGFITSLNPGHDSEASARYFLWEIIDNNALEHQAEEVTLRLTVTIVRSYGRQAQLAVAQDSSYRKPSCSRQTAPGCQWCS